MKFHKGLEKKIVVVTGASSGIGFAAALALAGQGAFVIGAGRSAARCEEARQRILKEHPAAAIEFELADLSSQRQVRALAASIRSRVASSGQAKIDALVNNAAAVTGWYTATEDGYEMQFAVNHLAPFLLTHELLALLQAAPAARVITVSSGSHRSARIHWRDVMLRRIYNPLLAYKQSKLANVLFSMEFNRRYGQDAGLRAYAADPGLVNTHIGLKNTHPLVRWIWNLRRTGGATPTEGAETVVFLATCPSIEGSPEVYWKKCRPLPPSRYAQREDEAVRLWELSERLCGFTPSAKRS